MATRQLASCPSCKAQTDANALFCVHCGSAMDGASSLHVDARGARAAAHTVAIEYLGVLAVVFLTILLAPQASADPGSFLPSLAISGSLLGVGFLGALRLGANSLRDSLAGPPSGKQLLAAALIAVPCLALNCVILAGMDALRGWPLEWPVIERPEPLLLPLLTVALLPALVEEWICRGVLWTALRRLSGERATLLLSAALFALLHGLNGDGYLELPTRFLLGVVLGVFRLRTGSLGPPVVLHFTNNALALFLT